MIPFTHAAQDLNVRRWINAQRAGDILHLKSLNLTFTEPNLSLHPYSAPGVLALTHSSRLNTKFWIWQNSFAKFDACGNSVHAANCQPAFCVCCSNRGKVTPMWHCHRPRLVVRPQDRLHCINHRKKPANTSTTSLPFISKFRWNENLSCKYSKSAVSWKLQWIQHQKLRGRDWSLFALEQ